MRKYWAFAFAVHPIAALRLLWVNRRQKPSHSKVLVIGRVLFQRDFKDAY